MDVIGHHIFYKLGLGRSFAVSPTCPDGRPNRLEFAAGTEGYFLP
jgi:hypothetical protein